MVPSLIVAASALLSFTAAAPVQDSARSGARSGSLETRQAPSCSIGTQVNNADAYDSSCWNTLNIMTYLSGWKVGTPTCADAMNSAGQTLGCCVASEPWSTCFLRLATRQSNDYSCNQISQTGCSFPIQLDPGLDPSIASQVNYVVLSITMINNFFTSYYNSLQKAISSEGASLNYLLSSGVSDQLNVMNVAVNSQNAVAALTLGLAFPEFTNPKTSIVANDGTTITTTSTNKRDPQDANTGTSSSSAPQSSSSIAFAPGCGVSWVASYFQNGRHHRRQQPDRCPQSESSSNTASGFTLDSGAPPVVIFNTALQQSSNVAAAMWPSTVNSTTSTLRSVGGLSGDVSTVLNAGLQLIMSDIGTFIAFAGNGIFSTPLEPTDEASAFNQGFTGALDTYILSQILFSNSISATPGSIVTTNPCSSGSLCGSTYWSPVTGRQYSFSGSNTYTLLDMASSQMEADLPVLFDGAYNCTFAGQAGGSVVSLKADSSLNVACLSTFPMYIDGDCPEGATLVNGKCPFGQS